MEKQDGNFVWKSTDVLKEVRNHFVQLYNGRDVKEKGMKNASKCGKRRLTLHSWLEVENALKNMRKSKAPHMDEVS